MASDPYVWARDLAAREAQKLSQRENSADNMLLSVFQEEAARQRPYATMPARLAEAQYDRINAEPFQQRAAMRRYKTAKAAEAEGDDTSEVLEDGTEVITVGGKQYTIPATKKAE